MGTKHWSGTVTIGDYQARFYREGGFSIHENIGGSIGWVLSDETLIAELPSGLVEAIRAFRPNYPIDEV